MNDPLYSDETLVVVCLNQNYLDVFLDKNSI